MKLDIGCGPHKQEGWFGMDMTKYPGVDLIHNLENVPCPLADDSVDELKASHVLEHIKPWKIIDVMNDIWRIAKIGAKIEIKTPYGDYYRFDPTHCIHFMAPSWWYFCPKHAFYYAVYKPKPWEFITASDNEKDMELTVVLRKLGVEDV